MKNLEENIDSIGNNMRYSIWGTIFDSTKRSIWDSISGSIWDSTNHSILHSIHGKLN